MSAGNTGSLAVTFTGTVPSIKATANIYTLNIALASTGSSVTAGLISNTDYQVFSSKKTAVVWGDQLIASGCCDWDAPNSGRWYWAQLISDVFIEWSSSYIVVLIHV